MNFDKRMEEAADLFVDNKKQKNWDKLKIRLDIMAKSCDFILPEYRIIHLGDNECDDEIFSFINDKIKDYFYDRNYRAEVVRKFSFDGDKFYIDVHYKMYGGGLFNV